MKKASFVGDLIHRLDSDPKGEERACAERARRSPKFRFEAEELYNAESGCLNKVTDFCRQLIEADLFRLPYSEVVFEIGTFREGLLIESVDGSYVPECSHIVVAWQDGDNIRFRFYYAGRRNGRGMADFIWSGETEPSVAPMSLEEIGTLDSGVLDYIELEHERSKERSFNGKKEYVITDDNSHGVVPGFWMLRAAWYLGVINLFIGVGLLNLGSGIKRQDIPAPKYINSLRAKKSKPLIYGHTLVTIDYDSLKVPGSNRGGSHASPRVHWRRGHIRTLASGHKTLVRACLVGAPEGADIPIDRQYAVKASSRLISEIV